MEEHFALGCSVQLCPAHMAGLELHVLSGLSPWQRVQHCIYQEFSNLCSLNYKNRKGEEN